MFGNACKGGATQTVGRGITRIFPGVRTIFPVLFHIPIPPSPNSQPRFNASSSLTLSAPTFPCLFSKYIGPPLNHAWKPTFRSNFHSNVLEFLPSIFHISTRVPCEQVTMPLFSPHVRKFGFWNPCNLASGLRILRTVSRKSRWVPSIQPKFRSVRPGKVVHLKGGPVFFKLFRLDQTDALSLGPKFWLNGSRPVTFRARN